MLEKYYFIPQFCIMLNMLIQKITNFLFIFLLLLDVKALQLQIDLDSEGSEMVLSFLPMIWSLEYDSHEPTSGLFFQQMWCSFGCQWYSVLF